MAKKKYAEDLAKDYDWTSEEQYFDYIVVSLVNGNRQQVRDLFSAMHNDDKRRFLTDYLDIVRNAVHKSVLNICIDELCK